MLDPLALIWLASLMLLLLACRPWRTRAAAPRTLARPLLCALVWVLGVPLVSAPAFVDPMVVRAEARAPVGALPSRSRRAEPSLGAQPSRDAESSDGADACAPGTPIVVLGGGVDQRETDPARWEALSRWAIPRVAAGARLALEDEGAVVVVSGGRPGPPGAVTEADVMGNLLVRLGVDDARIVREGASGSTAGNAREVRALYGVDARLPANHATPRVRLVTLYLHMRRAAGAFAAVGFDVCAVPVGRLARPGPFGWRVVPDAEALARTGYVLHEWLGRLYYRLTGRMVPIRAR